MHKFFCYYNNLTESYELSLQRGMQYNRNAITLAEDTLLPKIRNNIQMLYENIVLLKDKEKDENKLNILDETELMISNLYYSLFASPLELVNEKGEASIDNCKKLVGELIKEINIPEYNRLCNIIKNNLENL